MNPLALELNKNIQESSQPVFDCLSEQGRKMFFPAGILTQSGEAKKKATRFNATIGIALENNEPMHLPITRKYFDNLSLTEFYSYAPPGGREKLRELWKEKLVKCNPSLINKDFSLPMVTNALTHGLCITGDLFVGKDDVVIIPDKLWGTYLLNFETRKGGRVATFPMFNEDKGFNLEGLRETIKKEAATKQKLVLILCFPNNPTGYTPLPREAEAIFEIVRNQAEEGTRIVAVSDDAYFGLFYEDSVKESLFSGFCDLHENVLAVKLDGATKESFAWGFRTGFITFGNKTDQPDLLYKALETKSKGVIRSTISSCNHSSQAIIEKILQDPGYWRNQEDKFGIMEKRVLRLKEVLKKEKYKEVWEPYPFNSGYFMCLRLFRVNAHELRLYLLDQYGVGTISCGEFDLRIAFSCIEEDQLDELYEIIYKAVKEMENR